MTRTQFCVSVAQIGILIVGMTCLATEQANGHTKYQVAQHEAGPSVPDDAVIVVAHVDVTPPYTEAATELLKKYRTQSLTESGAKNIEILQQINRKNHFTIIEEWLDQKALNEHLGLTQTKAFRESLQPMLGSPYDDRLHRSIQ
ncbi:MAG TPA: antibiotic biosynthesis monooxygenase family protein [Planktothrix sp.]|jgi:quinol monooxygenase YgiN